MKSISPKIVTLYKRLAEHTFSDCKKHCRIIDKCCSNEHCEVTKKFAEEHGVVLEPTGDKELLYMSPTGCVVPPHLRPKCSEFVCGMTVDGKRAIDDSWAREYYDIRNKILLAQLSEKKEK